MKIDWQLLSFDNLTTHQLYELLHLRAEVFVVEQDCVYQDLDNADQKAFHLMGYVENELVAYMRLLPPNTKYKEASIGRVITAKSVRRKAIGIELMQNAITESKRLFPNSNIKISAQCYLDKFYKSFGFVKVSEIYLEDGIDHQAMLLNVQ